MCPTHLFISIICNTPVMVVIVIVSILAVLIGRDLLWMWSMIVGAVAVSSRRACFAGLLIGGRGSVIVVNVIVVMIFGDWLIVIIIATLSFVSLVVMFVIIIIMFVIVIVVIVIVTHSSFYSNYFTHLIAHLIAHLIVDAIPLTQPSSRQSSISSIHSIVIVFVSIPP